MYKPILEDVRYNPWYAKDDTTIASVACLLVHDKAEDDKAQDEDLNLVIGYRTNTTALPHDASEADKRAALIAAAEKLIQDFDVKKAGTETKFDGDYENLEPIAMPNCYTLKEMAEEIHG